MSVFQQAANTEAAWENGPTERYHATIQEQYELARSFEPQTQANRDELIVQGFIAHSRYHDHSGFSPCQRVFGITPRMPRILTNDVALETSEVAEGPALDYQREHDCRVAGTTAFFKLDANKTEFRGRVRRVR